MLSLAARARRLAALRDLNQMRLAAGYVLAGASK